MPVDDLSRSTWNRVGGVGADARKGARPGRPSRFHDPATRAAVVRRYRAGQSTSQLAASYDVSAATIARVLERSGVRLRGTGRPRLYGAESAVVAARLARQGHRLADIAAVLGCSVATAQSLLYRGPQR